MLVEFLLVIGGAATAVCFVRGNRSMGLIGIVAGTSALLIYLILGTLMESVLPGLVVGLAYAAVMTFAAVTAWREGPPVGSAPTRTVAKRSVIGGLIGMVPGALVMIVPMVLQSMDVITSDQSQVGFLGIFFVPVGLVAGALVGGLTAKPKDSNEKVGSGQPR